MERSIERVEAGRAIGLVVKEAMQQVGRMTLGKRVASDIAELLADTPRVTGDLPQSAEAACRRNVYIPTSPDLGARFWAGCGVTAASVVLGASMT